MEPKGLRLSGRKATSLNDTMGVGKMDHCASYHLFVSERHSENTDKQAQASD